jgi:hypothetical protein
LLSPLHRRHPIFVVIANGINVVVAVVAIAAAIVFHFTVVVVTIIATIGVVLNIIVATVTVAITGAVVVVVVVVDIVALSLFYLSCSLMANPMNFTKASQGSIAHVMGMERLLLD